MSLFAKKENISKTRIRKISRIQDSFEALWARSEKYFPPGREKEIGLQRLQEACVWLSRSIAMGEWDCAPIKKNKTPEDIAEELAIQKEDEEALLKENSLPVVTIKRSKLKTNK